MQVFPWNILGYINGRKPFEYSWRCAARPSHSCCFYTHIWSQKSKRPTQDYECDSARAMRLHHKWATIAGGIYWDSGRTRLRTFAWSRCHVATAPGTRFFRFLADCWVINTDSTGIFYILCITLYILHITYYIAYSVLFCILCTVLYILHIMYYFAYKLCLCIYQ